MDSAKRFKNEQAGIVNELLQASSKEKVILQNLEQSITGQYLCIRGNSNELYNKQSHKFPY